MNSEILNLRPSGIWKFFHEITRIPRPSKSEEKIAAYIVDFAAQRNLECLQDEAGNVLIRKGATPGYDHFPYVCLQSHLDMVCEKNKDTDHDFDRDPIHAYIDGDWIKARGTTLGADNGIGIAAQLAILDATDIQHGPVECLFTVDEETGLTGAFALSGDFLKSRILINLDSEDDGLLFIGCAGGRDTVATVRFQKEPVKGGFKAFHIKVGGLKGGHSGDDIHRGLGNANKILNRILWHGKDRFGLRLAMIDGGNLRNAIAREAEALVLIPSSHASQFEQYVSEFQAMVQKELKTTEPQLFVSLTSAEMPDYYIDTKTSDQLINALYACPHGVIEMSRDIPNFVETSTNLASVKSGDHEIIITTSQRSSVASALDDVVNMVESVFLLIGADVKHSNGYPGWAPNPDSHVLEVTKKAHVKLFQEEAKVLAIHAGLECGLIGEKYPGMDMISYGPTMRGVHSPDEKLYIPSVARFWDLTLEVLKTLK